MLPKLAITVLIVACLAFPAIAHGYCYPASTRLAGSYLLLDVQPAAVEGARVPVVIDLNNCYRAPILFSATVNITPTNSACASYAEAFSIRSTISWGNYSFIHYLPAPHCASTYNVTLISTLGVRKATLTIP